jgi:RNA polymerase sigma factor (sigma-70 family)
MTSDDMELVRQYAADQSEDAFATLVSRYVNLVYSAALRQAGRPELAEEVAQTVFIILARKAGSLGPKTIVSGWLYRTACFVSAAAVKQGVRRQRREQEAQMEMNACPNELDPAWEQFAPLLDEAMTQLRDTDRDALVLRFFQNKSLREVGLALGVEERAAQKRVTRSLERLRAFFAARGIGSTTAIISGVISAHSVQAAPPALANSITAAAVAQGAAASGSTLALLNGALKIMAWTKLKSTIVAAAVVALAAGTSTTVIIQHSRAEKPPSFGSTRELSVAENAQYASLTGMTPAQAAETFFDALRRKDAVEAAKFSSPGDISSHFDYSKYMFKHYGGMKVLSLGKPFKGTWKGDRRPYWGVYVPYEIQLKNGTVKKWQVALACDRETNRWYWDGGM